MEEKDSVDYWREYFRPSDHDLFDIIDGAITVAASDCSQEFKLQRDRIVGRLFSSTLARCPERRECDYRGDMALNHGNNYSYREAEALNDELEHETRILEEVSRIKEILMNSEQESESVLFDSMRRLQLMELTVAMLKGTGIGITVNLLRKHRSKRISRLALALISLWKSMVDEWMQTTQDITGGTPDSMNSAVVDKEEEGLPSPPLDEGALITMEPTTVELSRFFDDMDDDGNLRNSGEQPNQCGNGRMSSLQNQNRNGIHQQIQKSPNETKKPGRNEKPSPLRKETLAVEQNRVANGNSERERHADPSAERKIDKELRPQPRRLEKPAIITQVRFLRNQQDDSKYIDKEAAVQKNFEAEKKRMLERYQEVENAKRQRIVQIIELPFKPKRGPGVSRRNPAARQGKQWMNR